MTWGELYHLVCGFGLGALAVVGWRMVRDGRLFGREHDDVDELLRQEEARDRWKAGR